MSNPIFGQPEESLKFIPILERLLKATQEGRIEWEPSSARPDRLTFSGQGASVVLESVDRDYVPPITFKMLGPNGALLVSWTTQPASRDSIETRWMEVLHPLYNVAYRRAQKIDETIKQFIREIDELSPGSE